MRIPARHRLLRSQPFLDRARRSHARARLPHLTRKHRQAHRPFVTAVRDALAENSTPRAQMHPKKLEMWKLTVANKIIGGMRSFENAPESPAKLADRR